MVAAAANRSYRRRESSGDSEKMNVHVASGTVIIAEQINMYMHDSLLVGPSPNVTYLSASGSDVYGFIPSAIGDSLTALQGLYSFSPTARLRYFFAWNRDLVSLLLHAHSVLSQFFSDSNFRLNLVDDPEDANLQTLFVYIVTDLSVDEALHTLDSFDDLWYSDGLDRSGGRVSFNLRFL